MVDSDLKVRGGWGGGGGVVKLERKVPAPWLYWSPFWCKNKRGAELLSPPPPGLPLHCTEILGNIEKF